MLELKLELLEKKIRGINVRKIINIPNAPKQLMKILLDAGYEAYVVGGCVRDFLLNRDPHDWDICTNAFPEQMHDVFRNMHVIDTGLQHGTLTVMLDKEAYEITTYQKDGDYSDHRHPDSVEFVGNLAEDLSRRDFTVNAMAADVGGNIVDLFDGESDLKNGILRCVGNPDERFQEDALRILRALRFVSRFGFVVDDKTEKAMLKNKGLLREVSAERVAKELSEILMGDNCILPLRSCYEILAVWIPEITPTVNFWQYNQHHYLDVWGHTITAIANSPKDLYIRLALLYHDLGKPKCFSVDDGVGHFYGHAAASKDIAEKSLRNLKFDNRTVEVVTQLVEAHDRTIEPRKPVIRRCLNKFGKEQFMRLIYVKEADKSAQMSVRGEQQFSTGKIIALVDEIEAQKDCFMLKDLAVNGHDLMDIGIPAGKILGSILNELLEEVMNETMANEKDVLLKRAKEIFSHQT